MRMERPRPVLCFHSYPPENYICGRKIDPMINLGTRFQSLSFLASLLVLPVACWAATDTPTITVGEIGNNGVPISIGYASGTYGSITPKTTGNGYTYVNFFVSEPGTHGGGGSYLTISGFSSNPGASWLMSVTCNGVTLSGPGATYSAGTITFTLSGPFFSANQVGENVTCTVIHK